MNEADTDALLEKRLVDLEVKAAYADDLLDQLNRAVFRQQQQIERLRVALDNVVSLLGEDGGGAVARGGDAEEPPPHY